MSDKTASIHYINYLQLDKILQSQNRDDQRQKCFEPLCYLLPLSRNPTKLSLKNQGPIISGKD